MAARCSEKVYFCGMNNENLIQNQQRTRAEREEMWREAGRASGETRRRRKLLRESIMEAADIVATLTDAERQRIIDAGGEEPTNREAFVAALWYMARQKTKDGTADRKLLMEVSGEMAQNVNVSLGNEKTPQDWAREALEALGDE